MTWPLFDRRREFRLDTQRHHHLGTVLKLKNTESANLQAAYLIPLAEVHSHNSNGAKVRLLRLMECGCTDIFRCKSTSHLWIHACVTIEPLIQLNEHHNPDPTSSSKTPPLLNTGTTPQRLRRHHDAMGSLVRHAVPSAEWHR